MLACSMRSTGSCHALVYPLELITYFKFQLEQKIDAAGINICLWS